MTATTHPAPAPAPLSPRTPAHPLVGSDMRPDMKVAYGQAQMITPAFDRLAKEGSVFTRAYCQIAVCAPSRNSFMSGLVSAEAVGLGR